MCLALPGKILSIRDDEDLCMGEVDFSGVIKSVCLVYTPKAKVGDYVVVHVGFAISILNEDQARATLDAIECGMEMDNPRIMGKRDEIR